MSGVATAARAIAAGDAGIRPEIGDKIAEETGEEIGGDAEALALRPAAVAPHAAGAPVRGSLVAAVAELARVAASSEQLQHTLSPLLRRGGEATEAAQALDEITQHLRGLEYFLAAIAADCPPDWRLDLHEAASLLRLHSQKLRLTCPDASITLDVGILPLSDASGDLELW